MGRANLRAEKVVYVTSVCGINPVATRGLQIAVTIKYRAETQWLKLYPECEHHVKHIEGCDCAFTSVSTD